MNWILTEKILSRYVITAIVLLSSVSFGLSQTSQNLDTFECKEFWISKNADWEIAYDDVKYSSSELILKSKYSVFGVIFPGSLAPSSAKFVTSSNFNRQFLTAIVTGQEEL